jgi:hypothetical protein
VEINIEELVPQYIKKIYEMILKGTFINENSKKNGHSELYKIIDNNETELRVYFKPLGYILIRRAGYFYFASDDALENQSMLDQIVDYIDIINFLKILDSNFTVDYRFFIASIEKQLSSGDVDLQDTASKMRGINAKTHREFAQKIVERLKKNGFVEEQDAVKGEYIVLNSYDYIESLLKEVEVYE